MRSPWGRSRHTLRMDRRRYASFATRSDATSRDDTNSTGKSPRSPRRVTHIANRSASSPPTSLTVSARSPVKGMACCPRASATTRTNRSRPTCSAMSAVTTWARRARGDLRPGRPRQGGQLPAAGRLAPQAPWRSSKSIPATAGDSLELTIDQYLQRIAERELEAGIKEFNAASGSVVIHESPDRRHSRAGEFPDLQSRISTAPSAPMSGRIGSFRTSTSRAPRSNW